MRVLSLASLELRRFRTPLQKAALAFLVAVPLLYGAIYLWTNWDPYGRLDQVPVAVVNDDQPVTVQGRTVDAGSIFVRQLQQNPLLGWRFVNGPEAQDGQRAGRYFLVITVPHDFSAKLTSGATATPQRAAMSIQLDDANGYIIGKMAETVQAELEKQITTAAVSAYFEAAFTDLDQLRSGLTDAANGATQLRDGSTAAQQGATSLAGGLTQLKAGSAQLAPGAAQVSDGVHQINTVAGPILGQVSSGLPTIASTAKDASDIAEQLTTAAATGTNSVARHASDLAAACQQDGCPPAVQSLVSQISTATGTVAGLATSINTRVTSIDTTVGQLQQRVPALQGQLTSAQSKLNALDSGAKQVSDGAAKLDSGIGTAQNGANQLVAGTGQLATGAGSLADGLNRARSQLPDPDSSTRSKMADTISSPVDVTLSNLHPATVYGRGLAPFFFGIALWVFGIVAFLLLSPVSARLLAGRATPLTTALAAWLPVFGAGIAGALLLFLVTDVGLGLHPVNTWTTLGLVALAVAAFTSIVHVLRLAFGAVGDALALVLLMIQLTSCGGLYPPQTLPLPFRTINPVLPMTYLVNGLRVTITGGETSHLLVSVAVLAGYLVVALTLLVIVTARQRTWTLTRLKPSLTV